MPPPILTIPVDDTAVKRFLDTFYKYQAVLNSQEDAWKGTNQGISDAAIAAALLTSEISNQFDQTRKLLSLQNEMDRKRGKRSQQEKKDRESAIEQMKKYGDAALEAGGKLAKISMAAAGGVVGGFWGFDKLADWAGGERRQAMGLGVSVGERQRASVALNRFVNADAVLENIANLKSDPTMGGIPFGILGINPANQNPAQLANKVLEAVGRKFNQLGGRLDLAQAYHLTDIVSNPDELRRLGATVKSGEFQQSVKDSNEFAKKIGITDETGKNMQKFAQRMDAASFELKDIISTKLSNPKLLDSLSGLTNAFEDLLNKVLTKSTLEALADGVQSFTKAIESGAIQKGFEKFFGYIDRIGRIIDFIASHIPGYTDETITDPKDYDFRKNHPNLAAIGMHMGGTQSQKDTKDIIGSMLLKGVGGMKGYPIEAVKGDLGNVMAESTFYPFATPDKGRHFGLWQFDTARQNEFFQLTGHHMQDTKDYGQAIGEQVWFHMYELTHKKKAVGKKLQELAGQTGGAGVAAAIVNSEYEVPSLDKSVVEAESRKRAGYANQITVKMYQAPGSDINASTKAL